MGEERLAEFYGLKIWPMDPKTKEGQARFKTALDSFKHLVSHDFFKSVIENRDSIEILEVCSGTGIGGCALAKILNELGIKVNLLVTDIRDEDLDKASEWVDFNIQLDVMVLDARETHKLDRKFDVVLMYGSSSPHFNPWDMMRVLTGISYVLRDNSLFIMEDVDRRYNIFYLMKYKDVITGKTLDGSIYLDMHTGYDIVRGVFKRTYTILPRAEKVIEIESYFWGIAELAALSWIFFMDVDIVRVNRQYFILAAKPRRKILPNDLSENPRVLKSPSL